MLHLYRRKQTYMYTHLFLGLQHLTLHRKNICVCISQHLHLHFSTFVLAFLDICACISRHVCLHLLTYVTSFTLTCSTCVIAFMVRARQMCSYWTVICRNTYNFCHDKCKQMHKKMQTYATTNAY